MKINFYQINKASEAFSNIIFLKNKNLWFFLSPEKKSRYFGGFLFFNNQALRFIDDIDFFQKIKEVHILSPEETILYLENNQVYFQLTEDSIEITFSIWQNINITFDIKNIFDNEPEKRHFQIKQINSNCFCLEGFLENDGRIKILIDADSPLEFEQNWQERKMDFDQKRNSPPYLWWIFNGIYGKVRKLKLKIIYPSFTAQTQRKIITFNEQNQFENFIFYRINSLVLNDYLAAGFPWFYENWHRDELLTFFLLKNFFTEEFLNQRLNYYLTNLEILWDKNKINQGITTADTLLWLILNLDQQKFLSHFHILEKYLKKWQECFIKNNQLNLPPFSTWMDTCYRQEAIEILALYLKTLRRFAKYNKTYINQANYWKKYLIEKIKLNPKDINIIFVFLLVEDIFSLSQWEKIFKQLLQENYLAWGGIATISKKDPHFLDEDDGELGKAYHCGNSWYYLNNLLVYCLMKINFKKYKKIIQKILQSSFDDLFLDGALGWSSEISSAKNRKSEGSLIQLWSMTSLIFILARLDQYQDIYRLLNNYFDKNFYNH